MAKLVKASQIRPLRRWALIAFPICGKTSFAMQMATPHLFVDHDFRANESLHYAPDPEGVMILPKEDMGDVRSIAASLEENVVENQIRHITVDSLTAFIKPLINTAMLANLEGENKNKKSSFMEKGVSMSLLQDEVCRYGTDVLFIWHKEESTFDNNTPVKETLTKTEYEKLLRNLNAKLEVVIDKSGKFGMLVENLRPKPGQEVTTTIWDDSGCWKGMPEKIDAFLASVAKPLPAVKHAAEGHPKSAMASAATIPFEKSKEAAIEYSVKQGYFADLKAAEDAYIALRVQKAPQSSTEMFTLWSDHLKSLNKAA